MTAQRQLILDIIQSSMRHLSAEEIFIEAREELPGIAMATVYNSLKYLCDKDYIRKFSRSGGADFYDKTTMPHGHLICEGCGKILDINTDEIRESIEKTVGAQINSYELSARYFCECCKTGKLP
ncbi:MAG: Fur family transcriptional regulator [Ruminiclostridium sp.]